MADHADERREFVRVPFNTKAEAHTGGQVIRSSGAIDLSMSGLRMATGDAVPAPDTPCRINIILQALASRLVVEARGKIVRAEPGTLAVEFIEIDVDSYNHLRQIILNNTDQPEKAEQEFASHLGIKRQSRQ